MVKNDIDDSSDYYILFSHILGFNKSKKFEFDLSK